MVRRRGRRAIAATGFAALLLISACTSAAHHAAVSISVTPRVGALDSPLSVVVRGLPHTSTVTVTASAVDASHTTWTAQASYRVPADGIISLSQPSIAGSYRGSDPMGLLLTMAPPLSDTNAVSFVGPDSGYPVRLTARVDGSTVATATAVRQPANPTQVRDIPLRPGRDGVYGDLLVPTQIHGRHPAVLMLGGSEGGESFKVDASVLAAHGYPALALAYFGEAGLPNQLLDIPLEYFAKAVRVLRAQPEVDPHHVLAYGVSRGGELALLLGATYPAEIDGVIAGSPSSTVNGSYPAEGGSAWTLHGKPLPRGRPIGVERIHGPILDACGEQDIVWPSCASLTAIGNRLAAHNFRFPVTTLRFPNAGHFGGALTCCASVVHDYGGTESGDALAQLQGSRARLEFLAQQ